MKYLPRVILFLAVPALLFVFPWWTLVAAPSGGTGALFALGTAACVLGALALPAAMVLGHGPRQSDAAALLGDTLLGVAWVFFTWSALGAVVNVALGAAGIAGHAGPVALAVLVIASALICYGLAEAARVPGGGPPGGRGRRAGPRRRIRRTHRETPRRGGAAAVGGSR
ncbi:hypothetical protein [Nocardia farcinica]|uniref:hypothetical protein n=1 Tax=Nocardia farcinica TaxID=37329 RepID=UPI002457BD78|nr:hypothetical protein [Nocardia farcinica]